MSRDSNKQSEITKFKRDIIKLLYSNPDIIEMLDCDEVDPSCPDTAVGTCIFNRLRVTFVPKKVQSYVCVEASSPKICNNELYKNVVLTIAVVCNENHMDVKGQYGNRLDIISGDIVSALNWRKDLGFSLELVSDTAELLKDGEYSWRVLKFHTIRSNSIENGAKIN